MIFHFIYFYDPDISRPLQYFNYLTIKSCFLTQNKPVIYLHYTNEPQNNIWWEKIKQYVVLKKVENLPDITLVCNNKKVWRIEHRCDIFRLLILKEYGGVYSDMDMLFYRPFFPKFEKHELTMGKELYNNNIVGLCNGLIISKQNAKFLDLWYESYLEEYDDVHWNKMSVLKPFELSIKYPSLINVESENVFHKYNWCEKILEETEDYNDDEIYSKHLYSSKLYDKLSNITKHDLQTNKSLFAKMCRNIDGLL